MRLFKGSVNQTFELTEKQILLEYGYIFIEGETIEKAIKLDFDKWIFTNYRLVLVQACKGKKYELQSIPYSTIRKFSVIRSSSADQGAELNIYLHYELNPISKQIKRVQLVDEINKILSNYTLSPTRKVTEVPMVKLN